jgi:hypothetical protein
MQDAHQIRGYGELTGRFSCHWFVSVSLARGRFFGRNFGWRSSDDKAKAKFLSAVLPKARTICAAIYEMK